MKTSEVIKELQELKFFKSESQALAIQHAIDFMKEYSWKKIDSYDIPDCRATLVHVSFNKCSYTAVKKDDVWYSFGAIGWQKLYADPTHWMPLPPQPTEDVE